MSHDRKIIKTKETAFAKKFPATSKILINTTTIEQVPHFQYLT